MLTDRSLAAVHSTQIAVLGAGSIGCFVGASLLHAGGSVILIGRARMQEKIAAQGLHFSDLHGRQSELLPEQVPYAEDASVLRSAGLILVCVKSADTAQAATSIAQYAAPDALVISLQNGIGNADVLRGRVPQAVLAGMVPFNVVQSEDGRFHRGTEGEIMVEACAQLATWHPLFAAANVPLIERQNFLSVQWGKLLMNLNNAVNGLSGLPLKSQLSQRSYRRCTALLVEEALNVLGRAGIRPAKVSRIAPRLFPLVLRLPDALFSRIAAASLRIDPSARSSTWEDLQARRTTEVDFLNGAVVRLAESSGGDAPVNRRMLALVKQAEQGNLSSLSGAEMERRLRGQ